jgi:hypothetical protein
MVQKARVVGFCAKWHLNVFCNMPVAQGHVSLSNNYKATKEAYLHVTVPGKARLAILRKSGPFRVLFFGPSTARPLFIYLGLALL